MSNLIEKLTSADPVGKWIDDFVNSDNPKFVGKTKEERRKMAIGAYYGSLKNESVEETELEDEESERKAKLKSALAATDQVSKGGMQKKGYTGSTYNPQKKVQKEELEIEEGVLLVHRDRSYARPNQGPDKHTITKDHGTAPDGSHVYSVKQPNGFHGVFAVKGDTVVGSSHGNLGKEDAHSLGDHYAKHGTTGIGVGKKWSLGSGIHGKVIHESAEINESIKAGDSVHVGHKIPGGSGYSGIVTKIDGEKIHFRSKDEGKFGHRNFVGLLKNAIKESSDITEGAFDSAQAYNIGIQHGILQHPRLPKDDFESYKTYQAYLKGYEIGFYGKDRTDTEEYLDTHQAYPVIPTSSDAGVRESFVVRTLRGKKVFEAPTEVEAKQKAEELIKATKKRHFVQLVNN